MTAKELLNKHIPNDEINFSVNSFGVGFFFIVIAILFLRISINESRILKKPKIALFLCHGNMLGNMQQLSVESFSRCWHCEDAGFLICQLGKNMSLFSCFVLCSAGRRKSPS